MSLVMALVGVCTAAQTIPRQFGTEDIPSLQGRVERLAAPTSALLFEPAAISTAKDPRAGAAYAFCVAVYADQTGEYFHRFTVHAPNGSWRPLVNRVARTAAVLWSGADRRFGNLCAGLRERPVDIWLSSTGTAGGEHWHTHIYFYDIGSTRTEIEWLREIAHEYGHYLLPGASGYAAPEDWANGVLGERLFLSWMRKDVEDGLLPERDLPFASPADLRMYCDRQVTPLVEPADGRPPAAGLLARTDRAGFDAFTALMLTIDRVYGPTAILDILEYLPDPMAPSHGGAAYLQALEGWVRGSTRLNTRIRRSPASVYLPAGSWRVRCAGRLASWDVDGERAVRDGDAWTVRVRKPGWKTISWSGDSEFPLTWEKR